MNIYVGSEITSREKIEFNNDNIITGYIKQLLHSFNLPSCKVFNSLDDMITYYDNNEAISIVKNYYNNSPYIVVALLCQP